MQEKALLIILDGWGHGKDEKVSALAQANTPYIDSLYKNYPNAELVTYGKEVGLPEGQMGNSEVGHLNIGAGRKVYQELARINKAVEDDSLRENPVIQAAIANARSSNNEIHLMGLLSDGGVHSHIDHIIALAGYFSDADLRVFVHAFLDGRDTGPKTGKEFLKTLLTNVSDQVELVSIIGRYYAMDRDNRWDRIAKAYQLLVESKGIPSEDALATVQKYYDEGITDEFMEPIWLGKGTDGQIKTNDTVLFANFRTDRPRELTIALTQKALEHNMNPLPLHFVTMTEYDRTYTGISPVFIKETIKDTLGEVIAKNGLTQLRIAETEKYPHVTFFLSGGREDSYEGEERIMVNSPQVATYDLQPEMSAYELTNKVHNYLESEKPDLIILNYANADMVGHTGIMSAAIKAAEALDHCLEALIPIARAENYNIVIIADHGNSDIMLTQEGKPHTTHTLNMVPIILLANDKNLKLRSGILADVAPTLLSLMGINQPPSMDGEVLIS